MSRRILIIGAHPPTIGGVSIHIERLAARLHEMRVPVTVWDLYSKSDAGPSYVIRARSCVGFMTCLFQALILRDAVAHLHVSDFAHPGMIKWIIKALFRNRIILTIHSGSFPGRLIRASQRGKAQISSTLKLVDLVVAVNTQIATTVHSLSPGTRVSVVPPYIAPPLPKQPSVERRGIISSGYGTAVYGWLDLLSAYSRSGLTEPLHIVLYNTYDPDYCAKVYGMAQQIGSSVRIYKDLKPDAFSALLARCRVYVRSTDRDGDSLAVREALQFGLAVIATDIVDRPAGCNLFAHGDIEKLSGLLKNTHLLSTPPPSSDFMAEIIHIYGNV